MLTFLIWYLGQTDTPKDKTKYLTAKFTYDQSISTKKKKKKNQCATPQRELTQIVGCEEVESALPWLCLEGGESYGVLGETHGGHGGCKE